MTSFAFRILTPAGLALTAQVEEVVVRTPVGALGILANHQPMQAIVPAGIVRVLRGGRWEAYTAGDGLLTVNLGDTTLLAAHADPRATARTPPAN